MVFIRKPGSRGVLRPRFPTFTPAEGVGVPANALRLNGVPITLNGQYIILTESA